MFKITLLSCLAGLTYARYTLPKKDIILDENIGNVVYTGYTHWDLIFFDYLKCYSINKTNRLSSESAYIHLARLNIIFKSKL